MVESFQKLLCLSTVDIRVKNVALIYLAANRRLLYRYSYLHTDCGFFDCLSAVLNLMDSANLLALFVNDMDFLFELAHLDFGSKDCWVIAPKYKSFQELELAYRRQLVEQYHLLMIALVSYPVGVAPDKVVDYLFVKDLDFAVLGLFLCVIQDFDTESQYHSKIPIVLFYSRCFYYVTSSNVTNVCHSDWNLCLFQ